MPLKDRIRRTAIELTPIIHGARIEESAEEAGKSTAELIDFSINLNPLGPPKLKRILENAYKAVNNYPDNRYPGFKKAAAEYLNVAPENIVPGNGSLELIRLFAETAIVPGDRVAIPHPTFGEYEFQCRLFGAEIEHAECSSITGLDPDGCKAVFLCNPNNPTGDLIKREKILKLVQRCQDSETFLFVDEAFIELSDPKESIAGLARANDFIVVLRSLTKTFAIPGFRAGFAVASPDFAELMNNIRLPWNLNSIALAVGEEILRNNKNYISRSLELIGKERQWLASKLSSVRGFKPYPSDSNFILIDASEFLINTAEFTERLLRHGIIVRDCTSFGLTNHIRVAVRRRSENQKLIKAVSNIISERGRELAEKEISMALERGTAARSRLNCEYYPCHFEGQDCTFCFCPFYPCENKRTGGEFVQRPMGGSVWSCAKCSLIHEGDIAGRVLEALMKGRKMKEVWELVMEPAI